MYTALARALLDEAVYTMKHSEIRMSIVEVANGDNAISSPVHEACRITLSYARLILES